MLSLFCTLRCSSIARLPWVSALGQQRHATVPLSLCEPAQRARRCTRPDRWPQEHTYLLYCTLSRGLKAVHGYCWTTKYPLTSRTVASQCQSPDCRDSPRLILVTASNKTYSTCDLTERQSLFASHCMLKIPPTEQLYPTYCSGEMIQIQYKATGIMYCPCALMVMCRASASNVTNALGTDHNPGSDPRPIKCCCCPRLIGPASSPLPNSVSLPLFAYPDWRPIPKPSCQVHHSSFSRLHLEPEIRSRAASTAHAVSLLIEDE
jgi:hypothetical protein